MGAKPGLRVGLIGTGFMGKTHGFGFAMAPRVFDLPFELDPRAVADIAGRAAAAQGLPMPPGRWQGRSMPRLRRICGWTSHD